jgi:hypothetical protein
MKKTIITLLLLIICTTKIWGQIEVITPDGRKVILKNDGTWNYLDTAIKKNTINNNLNIKTPSYNYSLFVIKLILIVFVSL